MENTDLTTEKVTTGEVTQRLRWVRPSYQVLENGDYEVRVMMPGVSKSGVSVTLEDKALLIEGTRSTVVAEKEWRARYREISEANYRLKLDLDASIDELRVSAKTNNGVLILTLPVAEEAKPRKITID